MNDDRVKAQVKALQQRGELSLGEAAYRAESVRIFTRQQLEHSLATAFVKWTKERDPTERGTLWLEMHEMAKKLEALNG